MFKEISYNLYILRMTIAFKVGEIWRILGDIATGWYNYWLAIFNRIEQEEIDKHDAKALICTKECPLRGKILGASVCDARKEFDGVSGCGCIINLKLWSDSPCPRDLW